MDRRGRLPHVRSSRARSGHRDAYGRHARPPRPRLVADATRASADLTAVSKDTTVAQFQADEASSGVSPDLDELHADIDSLGNALDAPAPS